MLNQATNHKSHRLGSGCSNRILLAALAGIPFFTLFPFRLAFLAQSSRTPFSFSSERRNSIGAFGNIRNVLLFIPFGFGLFEKFCERDKSWVATLGLCLIAGALLSYAIEFAQLYVPPRDSGWQDVLTNTAGSGIGPCRVNLHGK
jgi:glycopeptide antibiotics resistance protein